MEFDRIAVHPKICQGKATVRGTRITAEFVLKLMGNGYSAADVLREYPALEHADVYQCATYGAWLASGNPLRIG
ncbi:MAG: hypothetical protein CL694_06025 [Chloroflexi bacterium]|nr:hypothetical protein [Chloroflexota bacterium]MDP6663039.1 DUF433 domain-containing protein [SAR202 cluster bacterium]MDP6798730.1 DUF433 domain-containing protein [SAR202 cluster bacterium]